MKQSRYIILTGIVMTGLLGVSYAYWTDSISANAIITTGNVKVEKLDWNCYGSGYFPEHTHENCVLPTQQAESAVTQQPDRKSVG